MSECAEIIKRLEKATGPDRSLDLEVHMAACPEMYPERWSWDDDLRPPPLTASIDAVIVLVEKVLPRDWPTIMRTALSGMAKEYGWHIMFPKPGQRELLPIALLLAFFVALEAKEGK